MGQAVKELKFEDGIFEPLIEKNNETEVERLFVPQAMYLHKNEMCKQIDPKEKNYMLPIYNMKSLKFHEDVRINRKKLVGYALKIDFFKFL